MIISKYPSPQRVLHIVGRMDRAGAETMLMNYYRAIDRSRYQFDFLVFTRDRCDYDDEIESLGGRILRIESTSWFDRTIAMVRLMKDSPWTAVHAHTNFSNMFPLFAACAAGVPVRISHAHVTEYMRGSFAKRVYQAVARRVIRRFATERAACGQVAGQLLYRPEDKVTIIPNAISPETFIMDRQRAAVRVRKVLDISQECSIILQVGRLDAVKNQRFTLEVARKLKRNGSNFVILLVGRGNLEAELRREIQSSGLVAQVRLLGIREDIPVLLNAADLFILPSLVEGFPVVLVEAQAAGVPCLVSDRVSAEVDLGMGLIRFLPVPETVPSVTSEACANVWLEAIGEHDMDSVPSAAERMAVLQSSGHSVTSATERLTRMYPLSQTDRHSKEYA